MTQRAFREYLEHSESNQREREQSDFVIQLEPKILRLVHLVVNHIARPHVAKQPKVGP